jgi:hypothetical protein
VGRRADDALGMRMAMVVVPMVIMPVVMGAGGAVRVRVPVVMTVMVMTGVIVVAAGPVDVKLHGVGAGPGFLDALDLQPTEPRPALLLLRHGFSLPVAY